MNYISPSQAQRYRRLHTALSLCVPVAFLGLFLPSFAESPAPVWLLVISVIWLLGFLLVGLLGGWMVQRRMLRAIDPDPETWRRVRELMWFRPLGSFWAVNELLRSAVRK
jgi:hypothetical protein